MSTIAILSEQSEGQQTTFSAVIAGRKATGRTAGEALDALTSQLSAEETGAPVILQQFHPDQFFSAEQRERLSALMARWRAAREAGTELPPQEQAEFERLVDEEVQGSAERTAQILREIEMGQLEQSYGYEGSELVARLKHESRRIWIFYVVSCVAALTQVVLLTLFIMRIIQGTLNAGVLVTLLTTAVVATAANLLSLHGRLEAYNRELLYWSAKRWHSLGESADGEERPRPRAL